MAFCLRKQHLYRKRLVTSAAIVALGVFISLSTASAESLGTASAYAVLGLQNTSINNSLVTINGNEGVSQGGTLTNMAPSTINGNVVEYSSGQYSGPGTLTGSVTVNPTLLTQNDTDALNAYNATKGLTPTQTFGNISSATTINGNGGLNVIDINGSITNSLTLSGTSNDTFILVVSGTLTLTGAENLLASGVPISNVLIDFTSSGQTISTHVSEVVDGTLLAPSDSFNLDGTFNGEIIGGGTNIQLMSGAVVNATPFTPVPEPSTVVLLCGGLAITGVLLRKRLSGQHS